MNFNEYFDGLRRGDYQIDNFKDFLKREKFSFDIPAIHVAGTNGKGSTSNYIASIYRKLGLKVGLYTSPFLFKFNEMIKVNDEPISDADAEKYIKDIEKLIKKFDLSAFEVQTYMAFEYFKDQKCDICVIECGMGGELDATNIFEPIVSVITSISLEHTTYLGRSISEVAYHKAGIIKEEVPLVIGKIPDEAVKVISQVAVENNSKIHQVVDPGNLALASDGFNFSYLTYKNLHIQSKAMYSVTDACIAVEVVDVLKDQYPVTNEVVAEGLAAVNMPCRMDFVKENPRILIDGGHNPEGMRNLKTAVENISLGQNVRVIFACFTDKNLQGMLAIIGELADELILTTFDHPRARTLEDYFLFSEDYKFMDNVKDAIKYCEENYPTDLIVVTGSLAFAAYVKGLFTSGELKWPFLNQKPIFQH